MRLRFSLLAAMSLALALPDAPALAQRGGRGGGMSRGGGGMSRGGMQGGGGMSRGGGGGMSRGMQGGGGMQRGGGGMQGGGGMSRGGGGGMSRGGFGGGLSSPGAGGGMSRGGGASNPFGNAARPGMNPGEATRPGMGGNAGRPGEDRPTTFPGQGSGTPGATRPGLGAGAGGAGEARPGLGAGGAGEAATRPGLGAGGQGTGVGALPGAGAGRPGLGAGGVGGPDSGLGVRPGAGLGAPGVGAAGVAGAAEYGRWGYGTHYAGDTALASQRTTVVAGAYAYPAYNPALYAGAWQAASLAGASLYANPGYGAVAGSLGMPAQPMTYDYGANVVSQPDAVYVNGSPAGTPQQYADQASQIASAGAAEPDANAQWQPLGVFAMVEDGQQSPNDLFQLAVDGQGQIRGNYHNVQADSTTPLAGSVDPKTQRAAWTIGGDQTPVYEAGIANLTRDQTTMLVHTPEGQQRQFNLIRLPDPASQGTAPTPNP